MAQDEPGTPPLNVEVGDYPTLFVDGVLASAWVGGTHRVLLGAFVPDMTPGHSTPTARAVVNLVVTNEGARGLIAHLQNLPGVKEDGE
jgi:hypothetical protein